MVKSDKIDEIIRLLRSKDATEHCPACGFETFTVLDGYFRQVYTSISNSHPLPAAIAPAPRRFLDYIVLVCENCGYIRQHAIKRLEKDLTNEK